MRKLMIAVMTAFSLGALALACEQRAPGPPGADASREASGVAPAPDNEVTSLEDIAPGFEDELDPLGPRGGADARRAGTPDRIGAEGERLEIGDADPDWEPVRLPDDAETDDRAAPAERVNFTLDEIRADRAGTTTRADAEVPAGSVVPVRLEQQLSTSENEPGDAFTATTTQTLLDDRGRVAIPAGALVRGRVLAVEGADADGETSMLVLDFESITAAGRAYPLRATVVDAQPERRKRTATRETAVKVGAGAAAGAILGQILGKDTESTLIGAAAGAAAGTAIALGTRDVEAVLPAGSPMAIRLDAPLRIPTR